METVTIAITRSRKILLQTEHQIVNITSLVVYRPECPCGCYYFGRIKRKLKERLAAQICYKSKQLPISHCCDTLIIFGQEDQRESFWISPLKAPQHPGLYLQLDF